MEQHNNEVFFDGSEFEVDEAEIKQRRLDELKAEMQKIKMQLSVPQSIRSAVALAALGAAGGMPIAAAGLMGILGFKFGEQNELNENELERLKHLYNKKATEYNNLYNDIKTGDAIMSGVMNSQELANYKYESYPFTGAWRDFIGEPSKNFHCMVFGKPKQGKSIFSVKFAKYLTNYGRVLYIAAEEGFSKTLQKKLMDFGMINPNLDFSNSRDFAAIQSILSSTPYDFVVIDSVNFMRLEPEEIEVLKKNNPNTAFVTVQQATKDGKFRGSQEFAHNCDIIVEVNAGVATQTGRFAEHSTMKIFDDKPQEKPVQAVNPMPSGQLPLFATPIGENY
jgi:hypothetical protein